MFKNKRVLVTGGTGSFGNAFVERVLQEDYDKSCEIIIFSRDEKKQHDMRIKYNDSRLIFVIGDVREKNTLDRYTKGVDYIFHAAALKQVPSCEYFPGEAIKTNVLGTENVLQSAIHNEVTKVVILTTDKAVYPINAMGMTKALAEKLMKSYSVQSNKTTMCGVRYGNVLYSRGSVIPLFIDQIKQGKNITITDPNMTRFLIPLKNAVDLVLFAIENGENGDIFVKKSPGATTYTIAEACQFLFNSSLNIETIGIRDGEKMHETLVTYEELISSIEHEFYYQIKNVSAKTFKELYSYKRFFTSGTCVKDMPLTGYTSDNTNLLNVKETMNLLNSLKEVREALL